MAQHFSWFASRATKWMDMVLWSRYARISYGYPHRQNWSDHLWVHGFFWSGHVQVQQQSPRCWFRHHPPRVCLEDSESTDLVRDGLFRRSPEILGESIIKTQSRQFGSESLTIQLTWVVQVCTSSVSPSKSRFVFWNWWFGRTWDGPVASRSLHPASYGFVS